MANRHPLLAELVEQMREEEKNTHTKKEEINMTNNKRDAARQHLLNIVSGNTPENRTEAIHSLLRLSDSSITREQVIKATSKDSPGRELAGLADTNLRSR